MTIPNFPQEKTNVSEQNIIETQQKPGFPARRTFELEYGPRSTDAPELDDWINELLDEEFDDVTVRDIEKDKTYVDTDYADWLITISFHESGENVYSVPINDGDGEILVEAPNKEDAVTIAAMQFGGDTLTKDGNYAMASVTITVPDDTTGTTLVAKNE